MLPFWEDLDGRKIHVQAPSPVIFLCGGRCSDLSVSAPLSPRDAFMKKHDNPATRGRRLILAEDVTVLSIFSEHYRDLLEFETDLAQITDLILLFCESEGSLAELGAFSMVDEIAKRLLVVIRDKHWSAESFVTLGPIRALEKMYGSDTVFVLDDADVDMRGQSAAHVKIDVLCDRLVEPIRNRLSNAREPTTFDANRAGHVIKLVVGLIQEYGALTVEEICWLLDKLDIQRPANQIAAYMLCAKEVDWIVKKRTGHASYYVARAVSDAATIALKEGAGLRNKARRRLLIREHWQEREPLRARAIREVLGGSKS